MTFEDAETAAEGRDYTLSRHQHYPQGTHWAEVWIKGGGPTFRAWGKTAAEALHLATEQAKAHEALPR